MAQDVTAKFKVDISDLKKGIQEANRQIRLANAEFKAAASGMDDWQKSTDGVQKKIDQLQSVLGSQKAILENYKSQLALIVQEYGEGSKEADEMRIKIANQQTQVNNTERSLRQYTETLADLQRAETESADGAEQQAESFGDAQSAAADMDAAVSQAAEGAEQASGGFSVFKAVLADLVATGIKAAIDGLKKLASAAKESFQEYDKGRDAVIKATGATGDAAKSLTKSYAEVAKSVGGSLDSIGDAVGAVSTRFGFTEQELENAARQFIKFADVTGTDAVSAVELVSRAMGDAGIESSRYADVLDNLAVASQASGISVDKLTELLTKYGAPMRALGFETKDAIAIFSQWEKAGVNTEIAFSGMKTAIAKWSADGKDARKEFQKTLDAIGSAPNIAEATTMAIEAFGKKAGPDLADAIQGGRFEYQGFLDLLKDSEGAVDSTFAQTRDATDKVKLAFQRMKVSLGETVDEMVQKYSPEIEKAIGDILPVVQNLIQWIAEKVPPVVESIKSAFEQLAPIIKGVFDAFMPAVKAGFEVLGDIISKVFRWIVDNSDTVIAALAGIGAAMVAWNLATVVAGVVKLVQAIKLMGVSAAFAAAKQWLLNTALMANPIGAVVAAIAGLVTAFVILWKRSEKFRKFWQDLWAEVQKVAEKYIEAVAEFFKNAWDKIKAAWAAVSGFFVYLFDSIRKKAEKTAAKIKAVWTAISDFFKKIFSGIRDKAEKAVEKIKSVFSAGAAFLKKTFKPVLDFMTASWRVIAELAEGCWKAIKAVWSAVSAWFKAHVTEPVSSFFSTAWNRIKEAAGTCWSAVKAVWSAVSAWFKSNVTEPVSRFFSAAWEKISGAASTAWSKVKGVWASVSGWFKSAVVQPVADFFSGMWDKLKSGASAAWDGIKSVFSHVSGWFRDTFSAAWQKVKDVFSTGGKVFDGIKEGIVDSFKTVVNAIIRGINKVVAIPFNAINGMLDKLKDVSIAGVEPFSGLIHRLPVPEIPQLSQGGVLKRGQLGLLEGDGAEAVVPLENNKKWIAATAAQLRRELAADGVLGVGNASAPTYTFNQYNTSPKALTRLEIYRQSKNLLRMLGGA